MFHAESRKVLETQRALLREIRNLLAPIEMTSRLEDSRKGGWSEHVNGYCLYPKLQR